MSQIPRLLMDAGEPNVDLLRIARAARASARRCRLLLRSITCTARAPARRCRLLLCLTAPAIQICKCHDLTSFVGIHVLRNGADTALTQGDQTVSRRRTHDDALHRNMPLTRGVLRSSSVLKLILCPSARSGKYALNCALVTLK